MTDAINCQPKASIIVPVFNEERSIHAVVEALQRQSESSFEVIFADGRSTDRTRAILAEAATQDARIRVIDNPRRLQSAGLNSCLAAASSELLIRLDGHCHIPDDYVERVLDLFASSDAAVVGGTMRAIPAESRTAQAIALANEARWGAGPARFHRDGVAGPADTVYLGSFRRSVVQNLGGWAEDVGVNEDYELNFRVRQAGHTVWLDPDLAVGYEPRTSFKKLAIQYFRYGRSKAVTMTRHPASAKPRQIIPAVGPLGLGVATAVGGPLGGASVLGASGAAVVVGAIADTPKPAPLATRLVAAAAAFTMHWTWSAGFWFGLVRPFPAAKELAPAA